jgi:peptidyl-dipeptidase Dcp
MDKNNKIELASNPLLQHSHLKHGAVNFPVIRPHHFIPALCEAIEQAKREIDAIKKCNEPPTFRNTIEALETSGELVSTISSIYFNLFGAEADEAFQALAQEISPMLSEYSSDISLDPELFVRVKSVYDNKSQWKLNVEEARLLDVTYKSFVRNGALLSEEDRAALRNIDRELSKLGPQFAENLLKATNQYVLEIKDEKQLSGLPDSAKEAMRAEAVEKGLSNSWIVTLHATSFSPFLTYADDRGLREEVWRAYSRRAFGDEHCNQHILSQVVLLRHRRATLLGYTNHAQYVLEERMAETPEKVHSFLDRILSAAKPAAKKELEELSELKMSMTGDPQLKPWDLAYYSEKLKQKKYDFDQEKLRPYFRLENVVRGVFAHAELLYGLHFEKIDLPTYHKDVNVYEVTDKKTGNFIGLFYTDFFPRPTKKGGAWMTGFREQGLLKGEVHRPHINIVCNFTKPTSSKPSLLTLDEVRTLFHEFGHALHGLLSDGTYVSISGTNVYWDFVELPSQVMENWVLEKEALDLYAAHFETGEKISEEMADKLRLSSQFMAGTSAMRQLAFGYLDMAWHSGETPSGQDVESFESHILKDLAILPREPGTNISCTFAHVFAGGYSAGYYSYKWAEVLEADAFELFKEKGLFNQDVAHSFRTHILARGGSEHPMDLYVRFRGREPDPDALLRRDGLI